MADVDQFEMPRSWSILPTFFTGRSDRNGQFRESEHPYVNGINILDERGRDFVGEEGITDTSPSAWESIVMLTSAPVFQSALSQIRDELSSFASPSGSRDADAALARIEVIVSAAFKESSRPRVILADEDDMRIFFEDLSHVSENDIRVIKA